MFNSNADKIAAKIVSAVVLFFLTCYAVSDSATAQVKRKIRPKTGKTQEKQNAAKPNAANDSRFIQLFDAGSECFKQNDFDCAIENFTQAVDLKPTNLNVAAQLSKSDKDYFGFELNEKYLCVSGENDVSLFFASACFKPETRKNYAAAFFNRGLAQFEKQDFARATEDFGNAITLLPNYAQAYLMRGFAQTANGEFDAALKDYARLVILNSFSQEIYLLRGNVYFLKEDYRNALKDYNQAIKIDSQLSREHSCFGTAYKNRGAVYLQLGKAELAQKDFASADKFGCGGGVGQ